MDMAPDRTQLQNMAKEEGEAFRGYARRWRELAARIQPPLSNKEMVTISTPHWSKGGSRDEEREDRARGGNLLY
ncbi:hypothetical protein CR513_02612, partial [Mucuna pruriens]